MDFRSSLERQQRQQRDSVNRKRMKEVEDGKQIVYSVLSEVIG